MWVGRCCELDERAGIPRECHVLCLCLFRLCTKLTRNPPRVSLATSVFVFLPAAFGLRDAVASVCCGFRRITCENFRQCTFWKLLWRWFDHDGGGKACAQQSLLVSMESKGCYQDDVCSGWTRVTKSVRLQSRGRVSPGITDMWTWDKAQSSTTFWSSRKRGNKRAITAAAPAKDALHPLLSPHPDDPCAADSSLFFMVPSLQLNTYISLL